MSGSFIPRPLLTEPAACAGIGLVYGILWQENPIQRQSYACDRGISILTQRYCRGTSISFVNLAYRRINHLQKFRIDLVNLCTYAINRKTSDILLC